MSAWKENLLINLLSTNIKKGTFKLKIRQQCGKVN